MNCRRFVWIKETVVPVFRDGDCLSAREELTVFGVVVPEHARRVLIIDEYVETRSIILCDERVKVV